MGPATFILQQTLFSATPLLVAGFGELLGQRAGLINVSIEGTMLMGAIAGFATVVLTGSAMAAIPVAIGVGILMGALFAIASVWFRADQIVAGTALNILAAGMSISGFRLLQMALRAHPSAPDSSAQHFFNPLSAHFLDGIPLIGPPLSEILSQYTLFYAALVLAILLYFIMTRTRLGLIIRSLGDAPDACDAAGIRVRWARTLLMLISGGLSGIAGAYLSTMRNHDFVSNMTAGRGFLVLALVIFGRWNVVGFTLGVLAFSAIDGFQSFFTSTTAGQQLLAPQYRHLFDMLPYAATLIALALLTRSRSGPIHLGRPWPE
ncbi:MAG TPA: ABC transporter permease [Phycisphaerae bacterium]|jgi:simple sugar transport system permease protein